MTPSIVLFSGFESSLWVNGRKTQVWPERVNWGSHLMVLEISIEMYNLRAWRMVLRVCEPEQDFLNQFLNFGKPLHV